MATSPMEGNLSQWVSQVQERHRGSGDTNTPEPINSSSSSAAELEEEIRRSRAERAKRRSHTGGGPLSPLSNSNVSLSSNSSQQTTTASGEETLRKLLGERGLTSPSAEMKTAYLPPSLASSSPPKQSNTLLDRYGGASGPTGVARAGTKDSPASLASFMGGKASGPRLGKLQGDGRSAPPEAALIDDYQRRPMPGMTSGGLGGGTPLASFLEARAGGGGGGQNTKYAAATSPPLNNLSTSSTPQSTSSSRPIPPRADSGEHISTQTESFQGQRNDRATSPLKANQVSASKELTPTQYEGTDAHKSATSLSSSLAPASLVHSPTSDALSRGANSSAVSAASTPNTSTSAAFQATQQTTDRMPTASLTRLRSKKMVEQRVREAQEKSSTDPSPSSSPGVRSAPAWISSTQESGVEGGMRAQQNKWPRPDKNSSPTLERSSPYMPAKFGNALPGMSQSSAVPSRNLYASNNRNNEERNDEFAAPVRLPGMGSMQSPFASRQATAEIEEPKETLSQTLEQLAKGRAKPKRTARASGPSSNALPIADASSKEEVHAPDGRMSREDFASARVAFSNPARSASPTKESTTKTPAGGLTLDTSISRPTERQSSSIDSAEKRIADSTAALEALLEGKTVKTPTFEVSKASFVPEPKRRTGTLKIAKNKDSHITIDTSAILRSATRAGGVAPKTISVEVTSIGSDGSLERLEGEEQRVLYETETQVIIHRFKESTASGLVVTKVYARTGRMSSLLVDPSCVEAKKVQEIGKQNRAEIVDARQGRESIELVKLLGGYIVTREGSRKRYEGTNTCLYDVRGSEGAQYIDQVDMFTSSLCSAHSAIVTLMGDVFVWHGIGSTSSIRQAAVQYAQRQRGNSRQGSSITEYEEGEEDELFWTCFDKSSNYSNAWHHRFGPLLAETELSPRLYVIQGVGRAKQLVEVKEFSLLDVRRDGIHILQLALEIYVLIGPDARSRRKEIQSCIEAASNLSRELSNRRGSTIMTLPVHVVAFPSIPPRELKSAFRYWHDDHLNGKGWQRAGLGMNVWDRQNALEQLNCDEFQLWQLNDEVFLPIGVGLEDVQGIDV